MNKSDKKRTKLNKALLVDALVWNCPRYVRDGAFSRCSNFDGTYTNCVKDKCSQVTDIFRTMIKIDNKEIIVY